MKPQMKSLYAVMLFCMAVIVVAFIFMWHFSNLNALDTMLTTNAAVFVITVGCWAYTHKWGVLSQIAKENPSWSDEVKEQLEEAVDSLLDNIEEDQKV